MVDPAALTILEAELHVASEALKAAQKRWAALRPDDDADRADLAALSADQVRALVALNRAEDDYVQARDLYRAARALVLRQDDGPVAGA